MSNFAKLREALDPEALNKSQKLAKMLFQGIELAPGLKLDNKHSGAKIEITDIRVSDTLKRTPKVVISFTCHGKKHKMGLDDFQDYFVEGPK